MRFAREKIKKKFLNAFPDVTKQGFRFQSRKSLKLFPFSPSPSSPLFILFSSFIYSKMQSRNKKKKKKLSSENLIKRKGFGNHRIKSILLKPDDPWILRRIINVLRQIIWLKKKKKEKLIRWIWVLMRSLDS